ncbi:hypothetical protein SAY87_024557 [Trapa incisa]|uniref:Uncharacterized protein n=1 Tax=Trapa incisa TaxID=236973 RepID=A0AAN7GPF4_9MYRT|nr:hypothetical protein SAY87_024557 [Trapa incisa]
MSQSSKASRSTRGQTPARSCWSHWWESPGDGSHLRGYILWISSSMQMLQGICSVTHLYLQYHEVLDCLWQFRDSSVGQIKLLRYGGDLSEALAVTGYAEEHMALKLPMGLTRLLPFLVAWTQLLPPHFFSAYLVNAYESEFSEVKPI